MSILDWHSSLCPLVYHYNSFWNLLLEFMWISKQYLWQCQIFPIDGTSGSPSEVCKLVNNLSEMSGWPDVSTTSTNMTSFTISLSQTLTTALIPESSAILNVNITLSAEMSAYVGRQSIHCLMFLVSFTPHKGAESDIAGVISVADKLIQFVQLVFFHYERKKKGQELLGVLRVHHCQPAVPDLKMTCFSTSSLNDHNSPKSNKIWVSYYISSSKFPVTHTIIMFYKLLLNNSFTFEHIVYIYAK